MFLLLDDLIFWDVAPPSFWICVRKIAQDFCKASAKRLRKGGCSTLEAAKRVWAGLLRSVLRSAAKQLRVDRETVLFLQGDLNSRTLLEGRGKDLLLEVLKDLPLQRAIQRALDRGLDLPSGKWYEAAFPDAERGALLLPVTYKFKTNSQTSPLRIGDVMEEAGKARLFPNSVGSETHSPRSLGPIFACWGLAFRKSSFRPFRFPACADRMIFWAPDVLAARLSWEANGGYKVWMDLLLRVAPPTETSAEEVDEDDLAVSVEEAASPATRSAWWARTLGKSGMPQRTMLVSKRVGIVVVAFVTPAALWPAGESCQSWMPLAQAVCASNAHPRAAIRVKLCWQQLELMDERQLLDTWQAKGFTEEIQVSDMREKLKATALWKEMPVALLQEECRDLGLPISTLQSELLAPGA
eukprot:s857_g21.t1